MRAWILGLALVFSATPALADDPYGMLRITNRNATVILHILRVPDPSENPDPPAPPLPPAPYPGPNAKVSGTNVNFKVAVTVGCTLSDPPGPNDWTIAFIKKLEISIGDGGPVLTWLEQLPQTFSSKSYNCRFASTWFPNDSTVNLKVKVWYQLQRLSGNEPPIVLNPDPEEVIVPVKIYNRALLEATIEDWGPAGFYVPIPPTEVVTVAQQAVDAVRPIMASDAMRHALDPGSYAGESGLRESIPGEPPPKPLSEYLKESTVFFAMTHGWASGFRASKLDALYWRNQVTNLDVENYVNTGRTVPGHNLVAMYACRDATETVGTGRFRTNNIDRAYLGFTMGVSVTLLKGGTLDEHALLLFQRLAAGDTVATALKNANENKLPMSIGGTKLPMARQGMLDDYARLHFVYLNKQERDELNNDLAEINKWYYIKELAGLPG